MQRSSVVLPKKPQISAPTIGIPNMFDYIIPNIESFMYFSSEKLSPNHLEAHLPMPTDELLSMIKVLVLSEFVNHSLVTLISEIPVIE